jgi:hypothetical protein
MHLSLDMSLEREEFFRLLSGAVGDFSMDEDGVIHGSDGPRTWSLRFERLANQSLGKLSMARHRIELALDGYTESEADAFLARFHRGFLRGGG